MFGPFLIFQCTRFPYGLWFMFFWKEAMDNFLSNAPSSSAGPPSLRLGSRQTYFWSETLGFVVAMGWRRARTGGVPTEPPCLDLPRHSGHHGKPVFGVKIWAFVVVMGWRRARTGGGATEPLRLEPQALAREGLIPSPVARPPDHELGVLLGGLNLSRAEKDPLPTLSPNGRSLGRGSWVRLLTSLDQRNTLPLKDPHLTTASL